MCVRMQWSAILMFLSVCRVWALPLAAVGRLRVGERQRCCGDPVCVVPPAHGALWPPADLGRHGAPHLQHIPWLLSVLLSFLFDFLTKYLIVLHFKMQFKGRFCYLKLHAKQGPSIISFSFWSNQCKNAVRLCSLFGCLITCLKTAESCFLQEIHNRPSD